MTVISIKKELEEVDVDVGFDEFDFQVVTNPQDVHEDNRGYTEKCFKQYSPINGVKHKVIHKYVCEGSEDPVLGSNEIGYFIGYKKMEGRGRRNALSGENIIYIETPAGPVKIPSQDLKEWAKALLAIDAAINPTKETKDESA